MTRKSSSKKKATRVTPKVRRKGSGIRPESGFRRNDESDFLGVDAAFVEELQREGIVGLEDFSPAKLRRLQRICRGLDLDLFAGWIIVDLLDQMDQMRRDLDWLRSLGTAPRRDAIG